MRIKGPMIFAGNHSNVHDLPMMLSVLPAHFFVLADDGPKGTAAVLAFSINGVIWVNRNDKNSAHTAVEKMREHLSHGHNLLIFPEGTWNTSKNLPVLPITWSTTELARELGCPIIPVTLEYPDFHSAFFSIGEPIYISSSEEKEAATQRLRSVLASMRWKFWESRGITSRENMSATDYDIYCIDRFKEYQPESYVEDYERERKKMFHPHTTSEQAFEHLSRLKLKHENTFLYNKRLKPGLEQ